MGKNYTTGTSIIGTNKNKGGYYIFVICNSLGFFSAISMIFWLTVVFPLVVVMHSSLNYTTCVIMVLPPDYTTLHYVCIFLPILYFITIVNLAYKR
ncbi:hypothetical protein LXL04_016727 [Taraxacum kok-saghyz]